MNTLVLILAAAAAVCGVIGGWRADARVLGVGVFLVAVILLLPTLASI